MPSPKPHYVGTDLNAIDPVGVANRKAGLTKTYSHGYIATNGLKSGQRMRSKHQRKIIALKLQELRLRGYTIVDASRELQLPEGTAHRYLKEFAGALDAETAQITANLLAKNLYLSARDRIVTLWRIYNGDTTNRTRISALEAIRKEEENIVKHAQDLGLVARTPQSVQHLFAGLENEAKSFLTSSSSTVIDTETKMLDTNVQQECSTKMSNDSANSDAVSDDKHENNSYANNQSNEYANK